MSAFYRRADLTERIEKLFALVDHCVDLAAGAAQVGIILPSQYETQSWDERL